MTCSDLHFRRIIGRRAENGLEVREVMEAQDATAEKCSQSLRPLHLVAYLHFTICWLCASGQSAQPAQASISTSVIRESESYHSFQEGCFEE